MVIRSINDLRIVCDDCGKDENSTETWTSLYGVDGEISRQFDFCQSCFEKRRNAR